MKQRGRILDQTDVVVATPVVASQIADKDLFLPTLVIFDEAGMMAEADSILVSQQNERARCFIHVGDYYQGGIIPLSQDNRTRHEKRSLR